MVYRKKPDAQFLARRVLAKSYLHFKKQLLSLHGFKIFCP